ncbi:MAG: diaminopimelate decarboxylase [Peptococcaceae bacterium]|nr:diaminopimelate decarboxylase [Peptococcaceae bacterium]
MIKKTLPFSAEQLEQIAEEFGTPFHIYDQKGIIDNVRALKAAFSWAPQFKEYFAVKATPNPHILKLLAAEGIGADCSSLPELILAERVGIVGEEIVFTSNDTPAREFIKAKELGAIINLDDISHIDFLDKVAGMPEMICFRYNPGPLGQRGNSIIGKPEEAKYGVTKEQLFDCYVKAKKLGAKRFGLHTMVISNELDPDFFVETARMMFELAVELKQRLNICVEFIDLGGGIGIPYRPEQEAVDLNYLGRQVEKLYNQILVPAGLHPVKIAMECGRLITGPYGYLVTRVIHKKEIYKNYVGVDACMADLMRPGMYGAYHHITVCGKENEPCDHMYDVTGSLCENNDKFAIDRMLPLIEIGDLLVIHDTGAHGHAMGFNYNGKLRSKELLFKDDGTVKLIRRAETIEDYFATLDFSEL